MQIDPEEFKRHYAMLSDEALLEIDRDELVDRARTYYDAELAERDLIRLNAGTDASLADPTSPTPAQMEDGLQMAGTFLSLDEANFARGLLGSANIPCSFEDERGAPWMGTGELRLMVPTAEYERACEILESEISEEDLIAQAEGEAETAFEDDPLA